MYRLKIQKQNGAYLGYQWSELSREDFQAIIQGALPLVRNVDPFFNDPTAVYAAIWDPLLETWISNVDPLLVDAYYTSLNHENPGI